MTVSFSVDANNDLFIGPKGLLAISTGIDAVLLACAHAARAVLGEMVLATDRGLPAFQTVWQSATNIPQYRAALLAALRQIDGVISVDDIDTDVKMNVLTYTATITTAFGQGQING